MLRGGNYSLRSRLVEERFKSKPVEKKIEEPPIESDTTADNLPAYRNDTRVVQQPDASFHDAKDKLIELAYYNPLTGFVGTDKLYHKLKSQGITRKDILHFLKRQEIVQITRKNNFKARSFIPPRPLYEFQVDLIYISISTTAS